MELAISVAGLAQPLAKATMECYRIFDEMGDVGNSHDLTLHELRTEGLRLKRWEDAFLGPQHSSKLDPTDYRYRYAVATLARIVGVFASAESLKTKYGISAKQNLDNAGGRASEPESGGGGTSGRASGNVNGQAARTRRRDRVWAHWPLKNFRSSSPSPSPSSTIDPSNNAQLPAIPTINKNHLQVLENPLILENQDLLPGLAEEISTMNSAIAKMQQSLSIYRKLRWVVSDKAELDKLLGKLKSLNDGLFKVVPDYMPTPPPNLQVSKLALSFDIPFQLNMSNLRKNPDFVDRESLLDTFRSEMNNGKDSGNVVVLHGTGGMGKTQLALEYVYRYHQEYSSTFWVNVASDQTTQFGFTQIMQQLIDHHAKLLDNPDYVRIGQLLGVKVDSGGKLANGEDEAGTMDIISSVKRWFAAPGNIKWLLVLDNLDDLESFDINEYIPVCPHGTIIITSRRPESTQGRKEVEVQEMQVDEAMRLLLISAKRTELKNTEGSDIDDEKLACMELIEKLGYLPLALDQAGAFIHKQQYSFRRYLREYERKIAHFLGKAWKIENRNKSVFSTWELSFEAIEKQNPKAAELLLICGYFNNEDICDELLRKGMKLEEDDTTLDDSIELLLSYSMAKRKNKDDSFTIHPLVHQWARKRLEIGSEIQQRIATQAIKIVMIAVTIDDYLNLQEQHRIFRRRNMQHVVEISRARSELKIQDNNELSNSEDQLGEFYHMQGNHTEAIKWYTQALAEKEKSLGPDHPDTLMTASNIAEVLSLQGKYDESMEWYRRVLAGREKSLGPDHPKTLATFHGIAMVLRDQERYDEAMEWYRKALAGEEKVLGPDDLNTVSSVYGIALVLKKQEKYDEAMEWFRKAFAGYEKALGPDNGIILQIVNEIAVMLRDQGKYDEAMEWHRRALAGYEKTLGPDHPRTLATVYGIALVLKGQGKYDEALEWYRRALAGQEKGLGTDHPDTLNIVVEIAVLFLNQDKYDDAIEWFQRALEGRIKHLGATNPDTEDIFKLLIYIYQKIGDTEKANALQSHLFDSLFSEFRTL